MRDLTKEREELKSRLHNDEKYLVKYVNDWADKLREEDPDLEGYLGCAIVMSCYAYTGKDKLSENEIEYNFNLIKSIYLLTVDRMLCGEYDD